MQRRSLNRVGGPTEIRGDPETARMCGRLLASVSPQPDTSRGDIHGFHTYPGRMHPALAAGIVETWSRPLDKVLDPFCGSGTILVEAMAASRQAVGLDLNPLAVRLASFKARPWTGARALALSERAQEIARRAQSLRPRAPTGEQAFFEPHMLHELGALRAAILTEPKGEVRQGLELILSAILVKLSRQTSDTRTEPTKKQLRRGFAYAQFTAKAQELARRLEALAKRTTPGAHPAEVLLEDARQARGISASTISLVATSPPYFGVFDYAAHHERRARWLGLDLATLGQGELGARRGSRARAFTKDMGTVLSSVVRCLRPGGKLVLVTEDGLLEKLATQAGLGFVAAATQMRTGGRREQLMVLRKRV